MKSDLLSNWGIDPGIVMLVLIGMVLILTGLIIYYVFRSNRLFRDYERFMRGNCDRYFKTVVGFGEWLFDQSL